MIEIDELITLKRQRFSWHRAFFTKNEHCHNAKAKKRKNQDTEFLVEAMGVEPMSALRQIRSPTCVVFDDSYKLPQKQSVAHMPAL